MNFITSYGALLVVYAVADIIAILGLNLQFGLAGIGNLAFIAYVSAGAYAYGLLTLGPQGSGGSVQQYFFGANLPFPLPFLLAALVACALAALTGLPLLRRLNLVFQYVWFICFAFVASGTIIGLRGIVNGAAGLSGIPAPLADTLNLSPFGGQYAVLFIGICLVLASVGMWLMYRVTRSPWGRLIRAVRDNDLAAMALGKSSGRERYIAFIFGAGFAGLSGAIFAGYTSAWSPDSWTASETTVFITALIVGGSGNMFGAILGALVVQVFISQLPLFLPSFASPTVVAAGQWILIGALVMAFIWYRPQGLISAKVRKYLPPERAAALGGQSSRIGDATGLEIGRSQGDELPRANGKLAGLSEVDGRGADGEATGGIGAAQVPVTGAVASYGGAQLAAYEGASRHESAADVVLETADLSRHFGGVEAVASVSIALEKGRITGLMGPNGAGKSTLVSMLCGEMRPTSGHILYQGKDVTGRPSTWMARAGIVRTFQLSAEFRSLSVIENLLVGLNANPGERFINVLGLRSSWARAEQAGLEKAWALVRDFDMDHLANVRADALSGGQRRLVELMRALMADPKVVLLDEPFAGISASIREVVADKVRKLPESGIGVLLVEHELEMLHLLADKVIVMARGEKVAEGHMSDVVELAEVQSAYVAG